MGLVTSLFNFGKGFINYEKLNDNFQALKNSIENITHEQFTVPDGKRWQLGTKLIDGSDVPAGAWRDAQDLDVLVSKKYLQDQVGADIDDKLESNTRINELDGAAEVAYTDPDGGTPLALQYTATDAEETYTIKQAEIDRMMTSDERDAMDNANTPDASNPIATMNDVTGGGTQGAVLIETLEQAASTKADNVDFAAVLDGDNDGTYLLEGVLSCDPADLPGASTTSVFLRVNGVSIGEVLGLFSVGGASGSHQDERRMVYLKIFINPQRSAGGSHNPYRIWGRYQEIGVGQNTVSNYYEQITLGAATDVDILYIKPNQTSIPYNDNIASLGVYGFGGATGRDIYGNGSRLSLWKLVK